MTANPLKIVAQPTGPTLTARQWYELAVAKGHREAAAAWFRRAVELGEMIDHGRMRAAGE